MPQQLLLFLLLLLLLSWPIFREQEQEQEKDGRFHPGKHAGPSGSKLL